MAADASAYAVLGLEPGADWADIEHAYKELIKLHHPDRSGGDAGRAAEIIHAYRELRRARDSKNALILLDEVPPRGRGAAWVWAALSLAAVGLAVLALGPLKPSTVDRQTAAAALPAAADPIDSELSMATIDRSVREAVRMFRAGDEMALAEASRDCHRRLRAAPSVAELDRCAAFDDAVVLLQDRDPLRSRGPFSELAVTSRQLSAGTILSNDALAVDSRLDRIRLHVELALAPPPLPLPPPQTDSGDEAP